MTTQMSSPSGLGPTAVTTPANRSSMGPLVLGSILTGAFLAALTTLIVGGGASEPVITGLALVSCSAGWGLLRVLGARRTTQPLVWATVPTIVWGVCGLALLVLRPSDSALTAAGWVWPAALAALTVWMAARVQASLPPRTRRTLLYPVLVAQLLVAAGGLSQTIRETGDPAPLSGAGRLYDVGDHRLYLECLGTGQPTVVLEAGMGAASSSMTRWIAPEVARRTRVCVYDRAGYGRSEAATEAPGPDDVTTDLHTLLHAAGVPGPYVLAGHSSGAVYVRMFAAAYPDEVAGLALLDGQPAEAMTGLPSYPLIYAVLRRVEALTPTLARFGVMRLAGGESDAQHYRALRDEIAVLPARLDLAARADDLGSTPLAVVTAATGAQEGWLPLQDAMTGLSTDAVHLTLPDATHDDVVSKESAARPAAKAVLAVVAAVRTGRPVALR